MYCHFPRSQYVCCVKLGGFPVRPDRVGVRSTRWRAWGTMLEYRPPIPRVEAANPYGGKT